MTDFPNVPTAYPVFYRTYARKNSDTESRESVKEVKSRVIKGLSEQGNFTEPEIGKLKEYLDKNYLYCSGRFLWCGGTDFSKQPPNYYSLYNCSNITIESWDDFGYNHNFLMQGNGSGAKLEYKNVSNLPKIKNKIELTITGKYGDVKENPLEKTTVNIVGHKVQIFVGDSRSGWVQAGVNLLKLSSQKDLNSNLEVEIDVSNIREAGVPIKGFGGVTNPVGFIPYLESVVNITNKAIGRQLTPIECSKLLNEAALCTVAGNVRRSARIDQFSMTDTEAAFAKMNLWTQLEDGTWVVDPEKDALRMANFTRVWHNYPTKEEIKSALETQFHSGEGAIQFAPEAVARGNADLLDSKEKKDEFIRLYCVSEDLAEDYLCKLSGDDLDEKELEHRMGRYGANPCFTGDMLLLTSEGYKTFEELNNTEFQVVNIAGNLTKSKVWVSGVKSTVIVKNTFGEILKCTPDHIWLTTEGEVEAKDLKGKRIIPYVRQNSLKPSLYKLLGFIQGDGCTSRLNSDSHKQIEVHVGSKDREVLNLANQLQVGFKWHGLKTVYMDIREQLQIVKFKAKPLPERTLPDSYNSFTKEQKASFLNGLYSANGSVLQKASRVTLKSTCLELIDQVQTSLKEDFGIDSYITTNKPKKVRFENGIYQCRESYDLNISTHKGKLNFYNQIGFFIQEKEEKLLDVIYQSSPLVTSVKEGKDEIVYDFTEPETHWGVVNGYIAHNCFEILGNNFFCNLVEVHLNLMPEDTALQESIFYHAGLEIASLLSHEFDIEKFRYSREVDPIVGISFTGLFDFFVKLFGSGWLQWWSEGRPSNWKSTARAGGQAVMPWDGYKYMSDYYRETERYYLNLWKEAGRRGVTDYCEREGLRVPNRWSCVQPAGTKSLLTGASPGWHPPKAPRYIRRITFAKNDPVALACIDYGYNVVPAQKDKDEQGKLLNDPFDERCTEWLVEIPVEMPWATIPGCDEYDTSKFSIAAQFDFYMQVQEYYSTHTTSATLEYKEEEIPEFTDILYDTIKENRGYVSAAMLARFDANATFPRLPFEPISEEKYKELLEEVKSRQIDSDFYSLLLKYDVKVEEFAGPSGCDGDKCLLPEVKPVKKTCSTGKCNL